MEIFNRPWSIIQSKSGCKICANYKEKLNFEPKINANIFKHFFSNLADDLLYTIIHYPKHKYNIDSVQANYKNQGLKNNLYSFICMDEGMILKLLKSLNPSKAIGIDGLPKRRGTILIISHHTVA